MNEINVVSGGCLSKLTQNVLFILCFCLRITTLDYQNKMIKHKQNLVKVLCSDATVAPQL